MRPYYDSLFRDIEGTQLYAQFIQEHACGHVILECACGSGDLMHTLIRYYDIEGIDIDKQMILSAYEKYPDLTTKIHQANFLTYTDSRNLDTIICVGDSLNYLLNATDVTQFLDNISKQADCLILDMHHPYRLEEFRDGYYEEGDTGQFEYMYVIEVEGDCLVHTINFMDGSFEQVCQWVIDPQFVINYLEQLGYKVSVYTDFEYKGIDDTGEKVMLVCNKG